MCRVTSDGACRGVRGATVWLTGLSGAGKSTVAGALATLLTARGVLTYTLDGDNLRHGLNGDLGFSADDRTENVRRVGEVARLFADAGGGAGAAHQPVPRRARPRRACCTRQPAWTSSRCSWTRPSRCARSATRRGSTPRRAPGELEGFTGIDDPYEAPLEPEMVLGAAGVSPAAAAGAIADLLAARGRWRVVTPDHETSSPADTNTAASSGIPVRRVDRAQGRPDRVPVRDARACAGDPHPTGARRHPGLRPRSLGRLGGRGVRDHQRAEAGVERSAVRALALGRGCDHRRHRRRQPLSRRRDRRAA